MSQASYLRSDLFSLLELQRLDTEILRLRAALDRARSDPDVLGLRDRTAEVTAQSQAARERVARLRHTVTWEQKESDDIRAEVAAMERKMYGGMVSSPKELDQMQKRVEHLRAELGGHEDAGLEAMVELEEAEPRVAGAARTLGEVSRQLTEAEERQRTTIAGLEGQLRVVEPRRATQATRVPEALLATYERIRERRGGVGVAALGAAGLCGGCLVEVPKLLLKHVLEGRLEMCESCGRLLIRSDEQP